MLTIVDPNLEKKLRENAKEEKLSDLSDKLLFKIKESRNKDRLGFVDLIEKYA